MSNWLVEIQLKSWEPALANGSRVIDYEEVKADDEYNARHAGMLQFERRCKHEPRLQKKLASMFITADKCCAPVAVNVDAERESSNEHD